MNNRTIKSELLINGGTIVPDKLVSRELFVDASGFLYVGTPEAEGSEPGLTSSMSVKVKLAEKSNSSDNSIQSITANQLINYIPHDADGSRYRVRIGRIAAPGSDNSDVLEFKVGPMEYDFRQSTFNCHDRIKFNNVNTITATIALLNTIATTSHGTDDPATFFQNKHITPQKGQLYFKYSRGD